MITISFISFHEISFYLECYYSGETLDRDTINAHQKMVDLSKANLFLQNIL